MNNAQGEKGGLGERWEAGGREGNGRGERDY